jgi:hypothetical protein
MRQVQDLRTDPLAPGYGAHATPDGNASNVTKEETRWHRIFRLPSQGEA